MKRNYDKDDITLNGENITKMDEGEHVTTNAGCWSAHKSSPGSLCKWCWKDSWQEQLCQQAIDVQRTRDPFCPSWEPCMLAYHDVHVYALFLTEGCWEDSVFALVPT